MTDHRISIALLFVAACGSSQPSPAEPPPAAPPAEAAPPTETAAPAPCPANDALASRLDALWKPAPATIAIAQCLPGKFPGPGWLVMAFVDTYAAGDQPGAPSASELRRAVLSADAMLAQAQPETLAAFFRAKGEGSGTVRLADLDGDGIDEIIEEHKTNDGSSFSTTLVVRRLAPPRMDKLVERAISLDTSPGYSEDPSVWSSTVDVRPSPSGTGNQLVLTTEWSRGTPTEGDLGPGTHVFELTDGALLETR